MKPNFLPFISRLFKLFLVCFVLYFALLSVSHADEKNGGWTVKVGSYDNLKNAQNKVKNWENTGWKTKIIKVDLDTGGKRFDICVGDFPDKESANKSSRIFKTMGILSAIPIRTFKKSPPAGLPDKPVQSAESMSSPPITEHSGGYSIQIGSYHKIEFAAAEVSRFKKLGYDSFYQHERIPEKGDRYSVHIGRYNSKEKASNIAKILQDSGYISFYKIIILIAEIRPQKKTIPHVKGESLDDQDTDQTPKMKKTEEKAIQKTAKVSKRKFSISMKTGLFFAQNIENFTVTDSNTWNISGNSAVSVSIEPTYRFGKYGGLYTGFNKIISENIDTTFFTSGFKAIYDITDWFSLYTKAGTVYGNFNWSEAPGIFEDSPGWESGIGIDFFSNRFKIGMDLLYRSIKFEYSIPGETSSIAYDDSLDFSGISASVTASYFFSGLPTGKKYDNRFPIVLKTGIFLAQNIENFEITQTSGSTTADVWNIAGNTALQIGFVQNFGVSKYFSIYWSPEKIVSTGIAATHFSFGPKFTYDLNDWAYLYSNSGVVYGFFDWDDAPVEFNNGIGWESGMGAYILKSRFKFGLDLLYRNITFDYDPSTDATITANEDSIDFSGFAILFSMYYFF